MECESLLSPCLPKLSDTFSGNAMVSPSETMLLSNNLSTGRFDLYEFPGAVLSTSLSVSARRKFVKPCLFAEREYQTAVLGSDDGHVYIYDTRSGDLLQTLQHETGARSLNLITSCCCLTACIDCRRDTSISSGGMHCRRYSSHSQRLCVEGSQRMCLDETGMSFFR